MLNNL
jgi:hypothetical protein